ncbi:MoaD/ThiS family protein [Candidatus Persebacteraceae bacterium Df01]|jgi:molybdopterin synthase sulfur carrier subunit|uniref:MoaD/ThiS family protein n=1 Tax=Candidatus Doriopsillibacter californiensis TaxID=2970740 RepID=A0ABT7QMQ8_9GAMM|nr:MoaD/ThiS family protein [Candidatus Persebacteraceae bacterium Df01]
MINIQLLFFGRLREVLQSEGETLQLNVPSATLVDVISVLTARGGVWAEELSGNRALAYAIDRRFAKLVDAVYDGAEVAIFPPITGG